MTCRGTLLVLTRGSFLETQRKRLFPAEPAEERRLHQLGLEQALASGRELGLRLVVSSPGASPLSEDPNVVRLIQRGSTFGERFADALSRTFELGGGPVIVVGTDTPGLDRDHLQQALFLLSSQPEGVVLGPAPDGGFYLMGANKALSDLDWSKVSWCTRATRRTLCRALAEAECPVSFLDSLPDLDRATDLDRWLADSVVGPWAVLRARLREILQARIRLTGDQPDSLPSFFAPSPAGVRAPPL